MFDRYRLPASLGMALVLLTALGCGGEDYIPIQGQVTLDGQPVVGPGTIAFYPEPGTESAGASAEIIDGKYQIPEEKGPSPGTFRVEIRWPKPTGRKLPSLDPGMMVDERVEAIPARYNSDTELKVDISSDQEEYNFDLKSQ